MKRIYSWFGVTMLLVCLLFCGCTVSSADDHIFYNETSLSVTSPNDQTQLSFTVNDGRLQYTIRRNDITFIEESPLGLTIGTSRYGTLSSLDQIGVIRSEHRTDTRAINGKTAVANDPCIAAVIPVESDDAFTLEARVFDNGVAFRYRLDLDGNYTLKSEETAFTLPESSRMYASEAHRYYEAIYTCQDPSKGPANELGTPATVQLASGEYLAVLEGDLKNYPGMKLLWDSPNRYCTSFERASYSISGDVATPWRIISIGQDLNELVNNTIIYQVSDEPTGEYSWVKPGRATWSWINGRTTERVTEELMREYTRYAAKLGFEYNIIDEGWINWSNYNQALPALAALGDNYDVGQILWTGATAGASFRGGIADSEDAYAFLDLLDNYGMAGGKIDYFATEDNVEAGVNLYRDILAYAAEKELVINFHGCNKPTGLDATYPNELCREAILGLESTQVFNRVTQAQMFVTQPFIRGLAGHADFTPAVDEAFHLAQLVLTDAPMQAIGSDPQDILNSPALEMIKSVPTVWQETVVLPQSHINESAVMARKGASGSWFVGGIHYAGDEELSLDLSLFLGDGVYQYELWVDGENGLEKTVATVTKEDVLTIPFETFTGFLVRFDRMTLSQYGGEIDPTTPIHIDIHDPSVRIAYTLDGREPNRFSKTLRNGDTLTLTESCVLTVKILSGEDKGLVTTYRFNRIDE